MTTMIFDSLMLLLLMMMMMDLWISYFHQLE
jgi:hypothetical protein